MFWFCDKNGVDNTPLFLWLLSGALTAFSAPWLPHWGCTRCWGRTAELTPAEPRGIPVPGSAHKPGEGGKGDIQSYDICLTKSHDEPLLSWTWLNTCLPVGSTEFIPYFAFALHIKLSLSQATSFVTVILPALSSILLEGREGMDVWSWAAAQG